MESPLEHQMEPMRKLRYPKHVYDSIPQFEIFCSEGVGF